MKAPPATAQAQASIGHPSYNMKAAGAGTINYVADWIGEVLEATPTIVTPAEGPSFGIAACGKCTCTSILLRKSASSPRLFTRSSTLRVDTPCT